MNILVIGGSYFLGKCFVKKVAENNNIVVLNRGSRPLGMPSVLEVAGDRHDEAALNTLKNRHYDAVVDFCAYSESDISKLFEALSDNFDQYIFISTVDVYERGLNRLLDEDAPLEQRFFEGPEGDYIRGKVILEKELIKCSEKYEKKYTAVRPSFIYGPENYAPREDLYFQWIEKANQIIHPVDATGKFQMVFVEDVAVFLTKAIGNTAAYNQAFNLSPQKMETYETFADALALCYEQEFERVTVTVSTVFEKNLPLPFPLTEAETNYYNGNKALSIIEKYTELGEGLMKTVMFRKGLV